MIGHTGTGKSGLMRQLSRRCTAIVCETGLESTPQFHLIFAEQEITMVPRMLGCLSDHLGIRPDDNEQTEARELMEELRRKFR